MLGSELVEPRNAPASGHRLPDALALWEPMGPRAENWARAQFHYLPDGKPAGMPCPHLDAALRCQLFGQATRPAVCGSLQPSHDMCGSSQAHAMLWLTELEVATRG